MRTLHWFRRDLRVRDNTSLLAARAQAGEDGLVAVYVLCPEQWREHDEAPAKVHFWLDNLRAVAERLESLRIPLRVLTVDRFDDVPAALRDLAGETGAGALHFDHEYEIHERRRDEAVREALEAEGVEVHAHHDRTALPPDAIRTQQGGPYSVFTPYKRAWIDRARESDLEPGGEPTAQAGTGITSDPIPREVEGFERPDAVLEHWPAGEKAAHARLRTFVEERVRAYADERDLPAIDATSRLSPHLAAGVLSPRQCLQAALEVNQHRYANGQKGLDTWISEIVWREFYHQVLVAFPRVCRGKAFRPELDEQVQWRGSADDLAAWKEGRTGYPLVDAAMRQLQRLGWMHNRLRMVTAMFLTKHLLIDWREGERHFMRHLIDGDLASNNGGWQWSASVGTDAAPYFRIFNPITQSERFDAEGRFILGEVPELEGLSGKDLHDPRRLPPLDRAARGYPEMIVDPKRGRERAIEAFEQAKGKGEK